MLSLLPLVPTFGAEKVNPFAAKREAAWQFEAIEEKLYLLEIAYGEHEANPEQTLPVSKNEPDTGFLSSSTRLSLATSSNEAGEFKEIGKHTVKYLISDQGDGSFKLKIYIETLEKSGNRIANTAITIRDSDWYVISGSTSEEEDGPTQAFTTAIRITPKAAIQSALSIPFAPPSLTP